MHPLFLLPSSAALANVLIASVWQGLLLTAGTALSLRLLPGLTSAAKAAIWTSVLVLLLALPMLAAALPHTAPSGTGLLHASETVSAALLTLWAAASAFRLGQLLLSAGRLRQILRRAQPVAAPEGLSALLLSGRPRPITLCTSPDIDRPSVAGFFRARILFPPHLLTELTPAELHQIVLHETEHLRRHDDWINLLQQISLVLLPLHPALLWLNRRLSLERELACDDTVLAATHARKAYAACLAHIAEITLIQRTAALVLGMLGRRTPELVARVGRILQVPATAMSRTRLRMATTALLASVCGSGVLLAHAPQLVSFSNPAAIASASNTGAVAPFDVAPVRMTPASLRSSAPRPMLAEAVIPAHQTRFVSGLRPALAGALPRHRQAHRALLRSRTARGPAARLAPWVVLTTWQTTPGAPSDAPVFRVTRVIFEQASPSPYPAVALRDSWFVVQL